MKRLISILILVSMFFPAVTYADNPDTIELMERQLMRANNQKRIDYYRGVYDVCLYAAYATGSFDSNSVEECLSLAETARLSKWYEQDSPGWRWPIDRTGILSG